MQEKKFIKTIAVTSGTDGTGKTEVTANLAIAMTRVGRKVLVIDADFSLNNNIETLLRVSPKYHIQHLLNNQLSLKDILVEGLEGVKFLSVCRGPREFASLTELQRFKLLDALDVGAGNINVLIINTASGMSDNVAFFCGAAQEIIVAMSPDVACISDTAALLKELYERYQEKQFRVLVNAAGNSTESLNAFRRLSLATEQCQSLSLDSLGHLPSDAAVAAAIQAERTFVELYPQCPATRGLIEICRKLLNSGDKVKGTLQFCIGQLFTIPPDSPR